MRVKTDASKARLTLWASILYIHGMNKFSISTATTTTTAGEAEGTVAVLR